ncbi:imelysin family protein [Paraglaciecola aquimarina]|uniref:Imelysin family protein n=1 Tax=Paraglaciecola aquimarina TaxID=1235557 RepID=A0ABU3SVK4_9ALTE|nr:imelysin family protein [Paraglaciecola aquimarina]MDU0354017.1 imelysin family protein [Paraglaciecola aquimarina]
MHHPLTHIASFTKLSLVISFSLILGACGGGGGNTSSTPTQPDPVVEPTPNPAADLNAEFASYLTDLTDNHIIPAYADFVTKTQALQTQSHAFCSANTANIADLTSFKQRWQEVVQAWQKIQWLNLGPALDETRSLRIQFWEPGTDAVRNGVEALLLRQGETIDAVLISGVNVGAQGIPALEYLLYPPNNSDTLINASNREKRCEIATAIADNLYNMSSAIHSQWQTSGGNYRHTLITGINEFSSVQDAVEELVTLWLEHINIVKDDKILAALAVTSPGISQNAEHYLSDESLTSITTNLATYVSIFTAEGGQGFDDILTTTLAQQTIATQVNTEIAAAVSRIATINQNLNNYSSAIANDNGRAQLTALVDELNAIRDVLTIEFLQALDISTGFNATDGD